MKEELYKRKSPIEKYEDESLIYRRRLSEAQFCLIPDISLSHERLAGVHYKVTINF